MDDFVRKSNPFAGSALKEHSRVLSWLGWDETDQRSARLNLCCP